MTLKRGLSRLEGVADAKLIVKPAHMEVTMKPGYWPDLPRMFDTIKRAGYTPVPARTELRVTGKLLKQADRFSVELDGMKTPLTLPLAVDKDRAGLEQSVGETVRISGAWQPPPNDAGGPGTLTVTELAPAGNSGAP